MSKAKPTGKKRAGSASKPAPDATPRRPEDEEIQERLRCEEFISELSARFVNLPAAKVDQAIDESLRLMAEFLGADRATLLRLRKDGSLLEATHAWVGTEEARNPPMLSDENAELYTKELQEGLTLSFSHVDEIPEGYASIREACIEAGLRSHVSIPLNLGGKFRAAIAFGFYRRERSLPSVLLDRLRLAGEIFVNAVERKNAELEVERLRSRLEYENRYLKKEVESEVGHGHERILGRSRAIRKVLGEAKQVAATDSTVLILGETGTGKELLARAIHDWSDRRERLMVKLNCAAIPAPLVESELFGREAGAYTGAQTAAAGRFEVANRSTLLLDEVGELPLELQSKLLRVLEEGEFERLGSTKTIRVDVRVIAATNRDLRELVGKGEFREDLYYRLAVFPVTMPPLRDRREDIPELMKALVAEFAARMHKRIETVPDETVAALCEYGWPGNVRELRNVVERAMILCKGTTLRIETPQIEAAAAAPAAGMSLAEVERTHILRVLDHARWRVRGDGGAAAVLGLKPTTLEARMRRLGIQRPS